MAQTRTQAAHAVALAVLLLAALGSQAKTITSAAQFLEINYEDMQCVNAVLERAGLAAALQDDLANTYFLPTDAAFLLDLGQTAPALSIMSEGSEQRSLTVPQIKGMIEAMPVPDAVTFMKSHVVPRSYQDVSALAFPDGRPQGEPDASAPPPTIKNSNGQMMEVVYEYAASNLYLSLTSGDEMTIAYVAGPVAFPVGKATVYIMHNILGNATLITGGSSR